MIRIALGFQERRGAMGLNLRDGVGTRSRGRLRVALAAAAIGAGLVGPVRAAGEGVIPDRAVAPPALAPEATIRCEPAGGPSGATPSAPPGWTDTLAVWRPTDGELVLGSGRRIFLADLRVPPAGLADVLLRPLAGSRVAVSPAAEPDRWERSPSNVALLAADEAAGQPAPGPPIDLAELLVGEGAALVDVGDREALCRPSLLRAEGSARRRRVGLWREPAIVAAADGNTLLARTGTFVIAEGTVVSVGERTGRTYLNFGRDWSRSLTAVVPRRTWAALRRRGIDAASLRGRTVRVRGTLENRRGPQVEIVAADMLERSDGGADGR